VLERRKDIAPRCRTSPPPASSPSCERPGQDIEELQDLFEQDRDAGLLFKVGVGPAGVWRHRRCRDQAGISPTPRARWSASRQGYKLSGADLGPPSAS
jgi:hypothetical protein